MGYRSSMGPQIVLCVVYVVKLLRRKYVDKVHHQQKP